MPAHTSISKYGFPATNLKNTMIVIAHIQGQSFPAGWSLDNANELSGIVFCVNHYLKHLNTSCHEAFCQGGLLAIHFTFFILNYLLPIFLILSHSSDWWTTRAATSKCLRIWIMNFGLSSLYYSKIQKFSWIKICQDPHKTITIQL